MLTLERLRELVMYDPPSGLFRWRVRRKMGHGKFTVPGDIAGFKETQGYWCLGIDGKTHKCHRLAWLWVYGEWPKFLDHINGDRADNRISNLRPADYIRNSRNAKTKKNSLTGLKGVHQFKDGTFGARIGINYERIYLGTFLTAELAHEAYAEAAKKYFGEFARLK
jgi:hypothetical protein